MKNTENVGLIFKTSRQALEANDYANAIIGFNEVIELCPGHELALANRGFAYLETGRDNEALNDFTALAELVPTCAFACGYRALALRNLGDYQQALDESVRAIELSRKQEDVPPARLVRGWLFAKAGQLAAAYEDLKIYIQHTNDPSIKPLFELSSLVKHGNNNCPNGPSGTFNCKNCLSATCGYSFNTRENPNWRQDGGTCSYSHCIDIMPARCGEGPDICQLLHHDCPGGAEKIGSCLSLVDVKGNKRVL